MNYLSSLLQSLKTGVADTRLRRVFQNAAILLRGHAAAGLLSLLNLAVAAHALGTREFGILVLVHTYAMTVAELFGFESWRAFVHFGANSGRADWPHRIRLLFKFTSALDLGAALLGTLIALLGAPVIGPWLGWDDHTIRASMLYAGIIPFTVNATPSGVLRLFGRFDLLSLHVTLRAALRLVLTLVAYALDCSLYGFLTAWFLSEVGGQLILVGMGWREFRCQGLLDGMGGSLRSVTHIHTGLWRFVWSSKIDSTVKLARGPFTILLVGGMLDPTAAGLFRVARGFALILTRPAELLTNSIYPDLSRLMVRGEMQAARRLIVRASLLTGAAAMLAAGIMVVVGKPMLALSAGPAFVAAYPVMLLLTLAAAIEAFGTALDPTLYALGRPEVAARLNAWLMISYAPVLVLLLAEFNLPGVGYASLLYSGLATMVMTAATAWYFSQSYDTRAKFPLAR